MESNAPGDNEANPARPTYYRSADGGTVHLAGCRRLRPTSVEWRWAEGKTIRQIYTEAAAHGIGYRWCITCIRPELVYGEAD